jgi:hypothetical protein
VRAVGGKRDYGGVNAHYRAEWVSNIIILIQNRQNNGGFGWIFSNNKPFLI